MFDVEPILHKRLSGSLRPIADIGHLAHHAEMEAHRYNRFVVRSTNFSLWAVVIVAALAWVATLADHLLKLGWGWDVQIIWIAPIIIVGALLTRALGNAIFRWVGAPE